MRINITLMGWDSSEKGEREKLLSLYILTAIATVAWLLIAAGPGLPFGNDYSGSPAEKKMAKHLRQIAQSSHGDWKRLSPAERRFLVYDVSYGDEGAARMLLNAVAGRLHQSVKPHNSRRTKK